MAVPDYVLMKRLLADDCEAVLEALAINVKREGGELHAKLANGSSIVMAVRGAKRGVWFDKADMTGGDTLEFVHRALGKEDHRVAFDWGKRFLRLPDLGREDAARALAARRRGMGGRQAPAREVTLSLDERERRAKSRYLYQSRELRRAPEIEQYLRNRGIPIEALPGLPKTLRFTSTAFHSQTGRELPAMLALIVDPVTCRIIAVHLTYLECRAGIWRKASVEPVKKVSATYRGGVIPLLRGASGKPLSRAPEGESVMIAEGIENALAAAILLAPGEPDGVEPAPRVFAAVSASNLPNIRLPPGTAEVILICDSDCESNPSVLRAYDCAERNWLEAGHAVSRQMPPIGFEDVAAACEVRRT